MQTSSVISRVQGLFGDSQQVFIDTTHIVDWINEAQLEIARETYYKVSRNTANNALDFIGGVAITDLLLIKKVIYDTTPLALIDNETPDRMGNTYFDSSTPRAYFVEGTDIYLWPEPLSTDTTTITVVYAAAPTDLTTSVDPLDCPSKFHNDLCQFVVAKAHERNENWRAAEYYMSQFQKNLSQRRFEGISQDDTSYSIGPDIMDNDPYFTFDLG